MALRRKSEKAESWCRRSAGVSRFCSALRMTVWDSLQNEVKIRHRCRGRRRAQASAYRIFESACKRCTSQLPVSPSSTFRAAAAAPRWKFLLESKQMQIRTFLADDEQAARSRLRRLLDRHLQIQIVGEAANGLEAVEAIQRLRPE